MRLPPALAPGTAVLAARGPATTATAMRGRLSGPIALAMSLALTVTGSVRGVGALPRRARAMPLIAETILAAWLSLRLTRRAMAASMTRTVAIRLATWLTNRELGFLALRNMTFGTRQRGANQSTMDGAFVFQRLAVLGSICIGRLRFNRFAGAIRFGGRRRSLNGCY